jgi:HPt (histidine-containing phosphotransfer) domain-containing protein
MQYDIDLVSKEFRVDMQYLCFLYKTYVKEVQDIFTKIDKLIIENDWNSIERLIHKIKGMSGNLKVLDVYAETEIIDDLIQENNCENLLVKIQTLKNTFAKARKNIIKAFKDKEIEL